MSLGFQAVVSGAQEIILNESEVVLTGGTESMSQAPFTARNIRFGVNFGTSPALEDTLWAALTDQHIKVLLCLFIALSVFFFSFRSLFVVLLCTSISLFPS